MRRTFLGLAAISALALSAATAGAETVLRLETYAGQQHAVNANGLEVWAKQVEEASGGDLKIEITYPPVNPRDFMDRVANGIADIAWMTHGYTTGRFVLTDMVELPGNGGNAEQISRAYWRVYTDEFGDRNEHRGVVPLALFTHGPGLINTRNAIESAEDLRGLKLRTGGGTQGKIAERLGIVTVSAPATQAHEILSQGVADGVFFSIETIKSFSLGDLVRYHYHLPGNLYVASMAIVIGEQALNKLTDEQKEALWSVSGEHLSGLIGSAWDGADQRAVDELTDNHFVTIKGQMREDIEAAVADLDEEWIERAKAEGVEDPAAVLARLRDEIRKEAAGE